MIDVECVPRFSTPRRDRPTRGHELSRIAQQIGTPLMPHQQLVADVGLEQMERRGMIVPAYREVIVTVPRQNGKTTIVLVFELHRCTAWHPTRPQHIAYSAQTGWDARKKLIDDQAPIVLASPFAVMVQRVLRGAGSESMQFKNGSRIDVIASTEAAGHGKVLDLAVLDEVFSDVDDRREQAVLPSMATRRDAQMLITSTAGTEDSLYLRRKVEAGRNAVEMGRDSGIAYFEWSAVDDCDIEDPATWYSCMPALGRTIDEEIVRHALDTMTPGEFRRSMLNMWTTISERLIPSEMWAAVCAADVTATNGIVFGVDCGIDRQGAVICAADSDRHVELVDMRDGVGWLVERAVELRDRYAAPFVIDPGGPAGVFVDDFRRANVDVVECGGRKLAQASAAMYDAIADGKVWFRSDDRLDSAAESVQKRPMGDAWSFSRRGMTTIPLLAATLALAGTKSVEHKPVTFQWLDPWDDDDDEESA